MKYKDLNDEGQTAMRNNGTLQFFNELCSKYSGDTLLKELKYQRYTHTAIMPHVKESTIKKWLSAFYRDSKHAAQKFLDDYNYHLACIAEIDRRIAEVIK